MQLFKTFIVLHSRIYLVRYVWKQSLNFFLHHVTHVMLRLNNAGRCFGNRVGEGGRRNACWYVSENWTRYLGKEGNRFTINIETR